MRLVTLASLVCATAGTVTLAVACADRPARAPEAPAVSAAPAPEPSITTGDVLAIHVMVLADAFAALERRLAWSVDSARRDPGYEGRYRAKLDVFDVGDPALAPHLDAWVARDTTSSVAHLARATYRIARASATRGGPNATRTSAERFAGMRHWSDLAREDLASAFKFDRSNLLVYFESLGIAMWYGEHDHASALLSEGLAEVPGSLVLRVRAVHAMRPRWGGSASQMEQLIDDADRAASINPRLRLLRGFLSYDEAEALLERKDLAGAIRMYTEAMRYGDHWQFRLDRAAAYYAAKEYRLAIDDYTAALASRPAMVPALAYRAASYDYLGWQGPADERRDSLVMLGRRDVGIALVLDSTDDALVQVLQTHRGLHPPATP